MVTHPWVRLFSLVRVRAVRGQSAAEAAADFIMDDSDEDAPAREERRTSLVKADLVAELKKFRGLAGCDMEEDPLLWWKNRAHHCPHVAKLARMVLAVPGSQIACERVFSAAGLLSLRLRNHRRPMP